MNELVYVLPAFIAAAIFFWVSFKFNTENQKNIAFQFLFFILALGMLVLGFAQQSELTHITIDVAHQADGDYNDIHEMTHSSFFAVVTATIIIIGLLLVFLLSAYFGIAGDLVNGKKLNYDRITHTEK